MKVLVAQHLIEGQFPVMWFRIGSRKHLVTYGCDNYKADNANKAAEKFGLFVSYQAASAGRVSLA